LGCEANHDDASTLPSTTPGNGRFTEADLVLFQQGVDLYNQKTCANCHNAIEISSKRNRTRSQISTAILVVPTMGNIFLTDDELSKIEFALSITLKEIQDDLAGKEPEDEEVEVSKLKGLNIKVPKGTRYMMASKFKALFLSSANPNANDVNVKSKINEMILDKPNFFGGFCNELDDECSEIANSHELSKNSKNIVSANTLRSGYLSRSCSEVLFYDHTITNALSLVNLNINSSFSENNIKLLWNELIPGFQLGTGLSTAEQDLLNSLKSLQADAASKNHSSTQQWRAVINSICDSPLMEAI
jgi:hypothetical protein